MGRRHEAKTLILLALGNDGQQRAAVETSSNLHLSHHIQTKAPNHIALRGFVVSRCSLVPTANGRTPSKQRSPRYKARAGAHFCKALVGANSVSFGALLAASLGKFLNDEWVDRFFCWSCFLKSKK